MFTEQSVCVQAVWHVINILQCMWLNMPISKGFTSSNEFSQQPDALRFIDRKSTDSGVQEHCPGSSNKVVFKLFLISGHFSATQDYLEPQHVKQNHSCWEAVKGLFLRLPYYLRVKLFPSLWEQHLQSHLLVGDNNVTPLNEGN